MKRKMVTPQRRYLTWLMAVGLLLVAVVLVSWLAFPAWHSTSSGFWALLGVALVGVVAFLKDLLSILKDLGVLGDRSSETPTTPRRTQEMVRSPHGEQHMKGQGGEQRQKLTDSEAGKQQME